MVLEDFRMVLVVVGLVWGRGCRGLNMWAFFLGGLSMILMIKSIPLLVQVYLQWLSGNILSVLSICFWIVVPYLDLILQYFYKYHPYNSSI